MSPAATRRYAVRFVDWEVHEVIVLAPDENAAIAKAFAICELDGLACMQAGEESISRSDGWLEVLTCGTLNS